MGKKLFKILHSKFLSIVTCHDFKKNNKSSENDQSTGHFQCFLLSPGPLSEKNPVNQLIKRFWPKKQFTIYFTIKIFVYLDL